MSFLLGESGGKKLLCYLKTMWALHVCILYEFSKPNKTDMLGCTCKIESHNIWSNGE